MATNHSTAFQDFFNKGTVAPTDWGGGKISLNNGIATYTKEGKDPFSFSATSNPLDIAAANKDIADTWNKNWGFDWSKQYAPTTPTNQMELFGQDLTQFKGPVSSNVSSSSNASSSFSGLDGETRTQLLKSLMPSLTSSIDNLDANIDKYTDNAVNLSRSTGNSMLKDMMPQYLDQLSAKGMINSDTGQKALSDAVKGITKDAVDKTYAAGMEGAQMKFSTPEMLSRIADLAKYSTNSSSGGSSSNSTSTNDMAGMELLLKALQGA